MLLVKPRVLCAILVMLQMCRLHLGSLVMVTPRYFSLSLAVVNDCADGTQSPLSYVGTSCVVQTLTGMEWLSSTVFSLGLWQLA